MSTVMALTFVAAALLVLTGHSAVQDAARRRLAWARRRMGAGEDELQTGGPAGTLFRDLGDGSTDPFEDQPGGPSTLRGRLALLIAQSEVATTPARLCVSGLLLALLAGGVAWLLTGSVVLGVPPGLVAGSLPLVRVLIRRRQRLEKLRSQLADAFGMMARVMRSGQTALQAMLVISEEFDQPIAGEFGYCYQQQNMGLPPEAALRDLARRTGLPEMRMFVVASVIHWQVGGNLAELLEKLAVVIRERFRIRGVIQTLTAEGRFQAGVLLALPFAIFGILALINQTYVVVLLDHPYLIAGGLMSELVGALWIRKIINFDF